MKKITVLLVVTMLSTTLISKEVEKKNDYQKMKEDIEKRIKKIYNFKQCWWVNYYSSVIVDELFNKKGDLGNSNSLNGFVVHKVENRFKKLKLHNEYERNITPCIKKDK